MRVMKAECAGSCYGVQRALDLARKAAKDGAGAQTLGPLIHNPQVVDELARAGVTVADVPADITSGRVVIRSHGVTPDVLEEVRERGVDVVDATCPHVLRAQKAARSMALAGRTVVVVGDADHPEVEGLRAWAESAGGKVVVASSAADLPDGLRSPAGVVVQTTQRRSVLDSVLSELDRRGIEYELKDTICNATAQRQDAAAKLAAQVDAMVVIGGHNSSNTTRLFEICADSAPLAFHIETADELEKADFEGVGTVGVTAGASTPEDQIDAVIAVLERW